MDRLVGASGPLPPLAEHHYSQFTLNRETRVRAPTAFLLPALPSTPNPTSAHTDRLHIDEVYSCRRAAVLDRKEGEPRERDHPVTYRIPNCRATRATGPGFAVENRVAPIHWKALLLRIKLHPITETHAADWRSSHCGLIYSVRLNLILVIPSKPSIGHLERLFCCAAIVL